MPDKHSILIVQVEPPQREDGGDYYYRTFAPGLAMAQQQGVYVINLTNVHSKKEEIMRQADVLVLKNICDPDFFPLIKDRKEQGKLTVYELADDLCAIPPWNPVHFFYKDQENLLLFKRSANYCDAIQFSVPELQRLYSYLNPCSAVFPNQITDIPPERKFENSKKIIIGWGGSHGHLEDMAEVAGSLMDWIISKDNVHLYLMCSDPIWTLFERLPAKRKRRFMTGSMDDYYTFLKKIDIGLAPLKDTAFNRSRSDVKFLEYAVYGVVPVVQVSVPYVSTVKHGETGFLFEDASGMLDVLEILTDDGNLISKVAQNAREYVIKDRLQHRHGKERIEFYRTKLAELNSGQKVNSAAHKIFEGFCNIEGAIQKGWHLRLMPTQFENLLHDGLVFSQVEGNASSAQALFSEASRLELNNYLPYLFGASCSGNPVDSLLQTLKKNPHSLKSWILLGEEYAKKGDIQRSIKCFESAAKIFPEYEVPYIRTARIMRGLQRKTDWISLLDKVQHCLSYSVPRSREDKEICPLPQTSLNRTKRVLLLASENGMIHHDCLDGFKALGWETSFELFGTGKYNEPDAHEKLVFKIYSYHPHLVLSINQVGCDLEGYILSALSKAGIPAVVWYVDNPFALLSSDPAQMIQHASLLACFDSSYVEELTKQTGVTSIHLPLGTNPKRFNSPVSCALGLEWNISFVGNLGLDMVSRQRVALNNDHPHLVNLVDEIVKKMTSGLSKSSRDLIETHASLLSIDWHALPQGLQERICIVAETDASAQRRVQIISTLSNQGIKVVGHSEWRLYLQSEQLFPPVDYLKELCPVYQKSRINLNISRFQLRAGVNQRVFDVPAAGGFLLTDRTHELGQYFQINEEVAVYEDTEDIKLKVKYYLTHEQERLTMINKARNRVLHEHTYAHRMKSLINMIGLK